MPRRKRQLQEEFPFEATTIISIEDIYCIINYIQVAKKECSFIAATQDSIVMEHLFEDCGILFDKEFMKKGVKYRLKPPLVTDLPEDSFIFDDDYQDEILEDGQLF